MLVRMILRDFRWLNWEALKRKPESGRTWTIIHVFALDQLKYYFFKNIYSFQQEHTQNPHKSFGSCIRNYFYIKMIKIWWCLHKVLFFYFIYVLWEPVQNENLPAYSAWRAALETYMCALYSVFYFNIFFTHAICFACFGLQTGSFITLTCHSCTGLKHDQSGHLLRRWMLIIFSHFCTLLTNILTTFIFNIPYRFSFLNSLFSSELVFFLSWGIS